MLLSNIFLKKQKIYVIREAGTDNLLTSFGLIPTKWERHESSK